jgi:DNA helicase-2/ATP-dependent DNA helicase PcrA
VERQGRHGPDRYREFIRAEFSERGLSATALNNYLTCPWKWFYENFFYTQFVPSVHQVKGTSVHKALEEYFNARNINPSLDVEFLISRFSHHLEEADLVPQIFERVHRDTGTALRGWYSARQGLWPARTENELHVKGVLLDNTILLTGKLDKLECLDDRCHEVRVIDYKTGSPKSRNEIEGLTESAKHKAGSGGYKRQLVFYKLLLDRWQEGRYRMREGVLDFIEPTDGGTYKQETFEIGREETDSLMGDIRRVAQEIQELSFWDTCCDDDACASCALRDLMEEG